jgi:ribosomal protein L13E
LLPGGICCREWWPRRRLRAGYAYPVGAGPLADANKIKTMQRQFDGRRDEGRHRLKGFTLHEAKQAGVG